MIAMISLPMYCKTLEEIEETRERANKRLSSVGIIVKDSLLHFPVEPTDNNPLYYLAKSLEIMSKCDAVYFCKGWKQARGCKIEHEAAKAYGLKIIYEE